VKHETRTMHLFAGHGGGLLADLILGHKPVVAVEWDGYACQVLRERAADGWFPGLRVWEGDVQLFDPSEYTGAVDCIHAGFPCQDISTAGKQAGVHEGTRSGLYREVLRIAGVVRPKQLFLENVSAILGNGLGTVLGDLAALGYDTRWLCIRASDVGAPHHRDRWFLLATHSNSSDGSAKQKIKHEWPKEFSGSGAREMESLLADTPSQCSNGIHDNARFSMGQQEVPEFGNNGWQNGFRCSKCGWQFENGSVTKFGCPQCGKTQPQILADTDSAQRQRNECTQRSEQEYTDTSGPGWWEAESDVGRVVDGIPHRVHRLKGLGNAQVPLQAAVAYRLLNG
jgi:DNA (cytosine-5)-methyltransferase 1